MSRRCRVQRFVRFAQVEDYEKDGLIGLIVSSHYSSSSLLLLLLLLLFEVPESALIGATFASDLPFLWYRWRCLTSLAFSMLLGDCYHHHHHHHLIIIITRPPSLSFLRSTPLLFSLVSKYAPRSLCSESPRARVRGKERRLRRSKVVASHVLFFFLLFVMKNTSQKEGCLFLFSD